MREIKPAMAEDPIVFELEYLGVRKDVTSTIGMIFSMGIPLRNDGFVRST
jgi:hypothetical protein